MRRALLIVLWLNLLVIALAVVGQVLVFTLGVTYTPTGQITAPTPLANVASLMTGVGGILSLPLTLVTFILAVVAAGHRKQTTWIVVFLVVGAVALVGLFVMAWMLLSTTSPIAFVTPFALIPFAALAYSLLPDGRSRATTSVS